MCNNKCYDIVSIVISLLLGAGFAILILFFPTLYSTGVIFAAALAGGALLLEAIAASTLLRQDKRLNDCVCNTGEKLLIPAIILLAVSLPALLMSVLSLGISIVFPIFTFIVYALLVYTFFSLYCFLSCLVSAGCRCHTRED